MAEEGKGLALAILGIVAVIAIVGLVLLFTSAKATGKASYGAPNVGDWGRMSTSANTDYTPTDNQAYSAYYRDSYPPKVRAQDAGSAEDEDREAKGLVLPRIH